MSHRINYNAIAQQYDHQPYRSKMLDSDLVQFIQEKGTSILKILDVACGTGNQLIANHEKYPNMEMVGCDLSQGMIEVARSKNTAITWMEANLTALPFADESFDYVTCQYAFHHVVDKTKGIAEIFRITAHGGRFVMKNISPHDMQDSLLFETFPQALTQDLLDYIPSQEIISLLEHVGFKNVKLTLERVTFETTLEAFLDHVSDKQSNSELSLLSEEDYQNGLSRLRTQINACKPQTSRIDQVMLLTIRADKI